MVQPAKGQGLREGGARQPDVRVEVHAGERGGSQERLADDALRGEALGLGMFLAVLGTVISLWKQEEKRTDIAFGRILFLVSWYVIGVNVCVMLLDGKLHWWQNVLLQSGGTIVYTTLIWVSWTVARKLIRRFWSGSGPKVAWR